jgi:GTP-binding protein HflX
MNKEKERAFLVGIIKNNEHKEHALETMQELRMLADTAEIDIVDTYVQNVTRPNVATYIGKGKVSEIANHAKNRQVSTLIFNDNLTPAQARNISNATRCNVVDRTELILDIFALHARTNQAKLQVELAQLEYSYTKLKRMWKHLSRIQGGIGFRGPGEKQIEIDRREIKKKISILKKKIKEIEMVSNTKRKQRQNILSVSLVGYTNAGKSTLFNRLTKEKRYVADQLFATLDAKTRGVVLNNEERMVLTDTIGFIRDLPHNLVSSFHSTLMEVSEADLLMHVVVVSHPNLDEYIQAVNRVLTEIGVDYKTTNILHVFNKCDLMDKIQMMFIKKKLQLEYPHAVFISAKSGEGMDTLYQKLEEFSVKIKKTATIHIPIKLQNLISFVHDNAKIIDSRYDDEKGEMIMRVKIDRQLYPNIEKQIQDYKMYEYINK